MEQRFLFGLLMIGEGSLALNYLLFCILGSLGALQFVAGRYDRRMLTFLPPRVAQVAGVGLVVLAYVWFWSAQPDLYIPGLAGGEFLVFAFLAFCAALLLTRVVTALAQRLSAARAAVERAPSGDF